MKKIIIASCLELLMVPFTGCSNSSTPMYNASKNQQIIQQVEESNRTEVYIDTETGVMYLVRYSSGITVMYNSDGSIKIHPDYQKKINVDNTRTNSGETIVINNNSSINN